MAIYMQRGEKYWILLSRLVPHTIQKPMPDEL